MVGEETGIAFLDKLGQKMALSAGRFLGKGDFLLPLSEGVAAALPSLLQQARQMQAVQYSGIALHGVQLYRHGIDLAVHQLSGQDCRSKRAERDSGQHDLCQFHFVSSSSFSRARAARPG